MANIFKRVGGTMRFIAVNDLSAKLRYHLGNSFVHDSASRLKKTIYADMEAYMQVRVKSVERTVNIGI